MQQKPIELTEAEWTLIKAVWEKQPSTATEIQGRLEKETRWTYSTVRTMMDRMVAKGLLSAEKIRNLTFYKTVVSREQAQQGEMFQTLKRAFDGALTPMVQCLLDAHKLSAEEISELERLIKNKKEQK